jgi:hypothetical protein
VTEASSFGSRSREHSSTAEETGPVSNAAVPETIPSADIGTSVWITTVSKSRKCRHLALRHRRKGSADRRQELRPLVVASRNRSEIIGLKCPSPRRTSLELKPRLRMQAPDHTLGETTLRSAKNGASTEAELNMQKSLAGLSAEPRFKVVHEPVDHRYLITD